MILAFDREPLGWVHPAYRRHRHTRPVIAWDHFVQPAMDTVDTLNHLLNLAQQEEQHRGQRPQQQLNDKYEVKMDVQQFSPNELDVKMVDNCVVIEGKHEEKKDDHGFISRHFVRRFVLPEEVKPETVTCNLSSDGILCISAPRMIEQKQASERTITINFTGKPADIENREQAKNVENGKQQPCQKEVINTGKAETAGSSVVNAA